MDIKAHWAEVVIRKWVNQGLAKGYGDGRFGPNDNITRAEFVTLLNRIFGYQQASEKSFPDVKAGAWYAAEIAKAYQAGIIGGDNNGNMNPEVVISRQEAAVILARAFSLAGDHLDAALKYSDVGQIAEWALGSVGTMTKKGYVTGRPGNLFAPKANLSRCEAVKMIDNVMGELINTSGTYTRVVPGNMVISSPGVTLKDTYIEGDLYLTEGIGTDTIQLIGVAVKGRTIIAGSIEGISLMDTLLEQDVLVLNEVGKVTITAEGLTEVGTVTVCRNSVLSEKGLTGSGFRNIQIAGAANGMEIVLRGDFDDITVEAPQANVMLETGTVGNFVVNNEATGTTLTAKNGTVIEKMTLYAEANITGGKNIKHAVIASGGVKMDQKPKQVTIAKGGHIAYSNQGNTQDQSTPRPSSNPGSTEKPTSTPTSTPKPT
ncbi:MAG: S-layer homology domain-containing protein, partial [Clostridiaceae bacterium]|nr:S-layer homology domain-containing protein [Clostridiaceae bacterium]